jgi:hypothetical protein
MNHRYDSDGELSVNLCKSIDAQVVGPGWMAAPKH